MHMIPFMHSLVGMHIYLSLYSPLSIPLSHMIPFIKGMPLCIPLVGMHTIPREYPLNRHAYVGVRSLCTRECDTFYVLPL